MFTGGGFAVRLLMRLSRCGLGRVERIGGLRVIRQRESRDENDGHQSQKARHHTALPRIRSTARRASESDSPLIFSRASATSPLKVLSAAATMVFASAWVFSTLAARWAAASERYRSRTPAASRLAA